MHTIIFSIDPGATGAMATIGDGQLLEVIDIPTVGRGKKGKQEINGSDLAQRIRLTILENPTAKFRAVIEDVHSMPKQGVASSFSFGQSFGVAQGVLQALSIPLTRVTPQKWKKHFSLIGSEKDAARGKVIDLFPLAPVTLKKHTGRADAILIGLWCHQTESF